MKTVSTVCFSAAGSGGGHWVSVWVCQAFSQYSLRELMLLGATSLMFLPCLQKCKVMDDSPWKYITWVTPNSVDRKNLRKKLGLKGTKLKDTLRSSNYS